MKINYSLLDQLKRYFQGELDATTTESIGKKLEEDPVYQAHAYIYKISQEGINEHKRQKQLKGIKDFPSVVDIDAIWEQDRQLTQKKRWVVGLLVLFIVSVASVLIVKGFPENPKEQPPIADQETESEVLFGGDGQEQFLSVVPLLWDANDQLIPTTGEQRHLVLHLKQQDEMSFLRKGDTLHLYTPVVDYDPIQWITTKEDRQLLRLGNQVFDLPIQQEEGILQASTFKVEDLPK